MSYTDYPKAASNNAKRALKYKEESGNPRGCGTPVGWRRATTLANRSPISEDVVKRMASFNRHRQHKDVPYDEGCGGLMWDAWGGTAGVDWAIRKSKEIDEEKALSIQLNKKALMDTLRDKAKEHNDEVGNVASKRTTASTLKKVYDRGIGAYRTNPQSVRPSVTSAQQWAFARVNSFLRALKNGKFSGGKHDTDLLPSGHPMSSKNNEIITNTMSSKTWHEDEEKMNHDDDKMHHEDDEKMHHEDDEKMYHDDEDKMSHDEDKMDHEEMKNYYDTVEEAQQHANMLGCSGTHTHEINGVTYYMACSTHNEYLQYEEQMKNRTMIYPWKTKNSRAEIKSVDMDRRMVEGYYSVFDFKDSDGDVIMKGAYEKTVRENGPGGKNRIMHLYQHDPLMVLGKPMALVEDEKGLYFKTVITDTNLGTDVLKLYRDGVLTEHSVGINFVQREYSSNDDSYIVKEVKMWEGSTVTWGANEMAIGSVKGSSKDQLDQYNRLHKAYYDGTYTDETFLLIEKQLKYLEQVIRKSLQNKKPTQVTLKDEAGSIANMFKQFNNQLQIEKEFKKWT